MDPRHRDRIAFVRIVSGEFERGMSVNLPRTGKGAKLSNVTQFMAESRENVTNAVAGDIIGVYDTGTYQVGDTLTVGKNKFEFEPLPTFTPEIFMKVSAKNVMKQKSFHKGIEQLVQEGRRCCLGSCNKMMHKISLRQRIQLYINFSYVCI